MHSSEKATKLVKHGLPSLSLCWLFLCLCCLHGWKWIPRLNTSPSSHWLKWDQLAYSSLASLSSFLKADVVLAHFPWQEPPPTAVTSHKLRTIPTLANSTLISWWIPLESMDSQSHMLFLFIVPYLLLPLQNLTDLHRGLGANFAWEDWVVPQPFPCHPSLGCLPHPPMDPHFLWTCFVISIFVTLHVPSLSSS